MHLKRAVKYLKNVMAKKEIVPFRRFSGCAGRKAQVIFSYDPCHIKAEDIEKNLNSRF